MPPLPSPGAVLRCSFSTGDDASIPAGSRVYLSYSGGAPSSGDLSTLATAVSAAWGDHIAVLVSGAESLHNVTIDDLSSDMGEEGVWEGTVAGSRTTAQLIASACAVVNHKIGRKYRGGRPRTYLRCGTVGDLEGTNEWVTGFIDDVTAGWEAFIAEILATTGIGITLSNIVNVSYYNGNRVFTTPTGRARNIPILRETPLVDNVTSSTTATKVGSQRRRLDI
jgi:hypothetical protein